MMNIFRITMKIFLVPIWIILTIALIVIRMAVSTYSIIKGILVPTGILLIAATAICYHDTAQIALLAVITGLLILIMTIGLNLVGLLTLVRDRVWNLV